MRDIPVFSTELGVASLTLSQIPYTRKAYIRIQDTATPREFIDECVSFCKSAGAEEVFATGHKILELYPLYTEIWKMSCFTTDLPDSDAQLFPVQDSTIELWREKYNDRMKVVPNATLLSLPKLKELLKDKNAYFVHMDGICVGLGMVSDSTIDVVVSLEKGIGRTVLCTLKNAIISDVIEVEVASANIPAIRLYEGVGFIKNKVLSCWYKVL